MSNAVDKLLLTGHYEFGGPLEVTHSHVTLESTEVFLAGFLFGIGTNEAGAQKGVKRIPKVPTEIRRAAS